MVLIIPVLLLVTLASVPTLQQAAAVTNCQCMDKAEQCVPACIDDEIIMGNMFYNPNFVNNSLTTTLKPVTTTLSPITTTLSPITTTLSPITTTLSPVTVTLPPKTCKCLDTFTKACVVCNKAALAAGTMFINPLYVDPNPTTTLATTLKPSTTTSGPTIRPNFVGFWDAINLWEQQAAAVPKGSNCNPAWVTYERKRQGGKNRRKYYQGNKGGNAQAQGDRRRGPCARKTPPLYY